MPNVVLDYTYNAANNLLDNQGTIRDVVDSTGTILNHFSYDAFGNVTAETNLEVEFRFGYTGRELDEESGLLYYRARYYDPSVGKFISEDPIGFAGGDDNLYRYVFNSPTNYTDPSGLLTLYKGNPIVDTIRSAPGLSPAPGIYSPLADAVERIPGIDAFDIDLQINAGEGFAEDAQRYWAERYIDESRPWYDRAGSFAAGTLSSLWTCENSDKTALTLSAALAANQFIGTPLGSPIGPNKGVAGIGDDLLEGVTPQNVLEGMSRKNLKHSQKHLPDFQKLDPRITDVSLRELGSSIVKPENLISRPGASQKVFEQVVDIGGVPTRVRVALNAKNKLHSIHIQNN